MGNNLCSIANAAVWEYIRTVRCRLVAPPPTIDDIVDEFVVLQLTTRRVKK